MRGLSCCWVLAALVTIASGCRTTYREGGYSCTPTTYVTDCPPAWFCHSDLLCWSRAEEPDAAMPDAAMPDGGPHDAAARDGTIALPDGCALATYYRDGDGDHYGVASMSMQACAPPAGYASADGDCDDARDTVHPGAADVCNGLDDDCSGMVDDGSSLQCTMGMSTSCTTSCGSTGTGTCSALCVRPSGASCTPPTTEAMCDGIDDDCNGVADEGLRTLGPIQQVLAMSTGTSVVVPTLDHHAVFVPGTPARMVVLDVSGSPSGSVIPLDSRIQPAGQFDVVSVASGFVLAYGAPTGTTGLITVATVDATGVTNTFGTLPLPSGYASGGQVVISSADTTHAIMYAAVQTTGAPVSYAIWRYRVDLTTTVPTQTATIVVTNVHSAMAFDALAISASDYVAYGNVAFNVELVAVSASGGVNSLGSIAAVTGNTPVAIAIAIQNRGAMISPANPLGLAWTSMGVSTGVSRFAEVRGTSPYTASTPIPLTTGDIHSGGAARGVAIAALPNTSPGSHLGHWLVACAAHVIESDWEVLGGAGTSTATNVTPSDAQLGTTVSIAIGSNGTGFMTRPAISQTVVRRIGCP
jgi:hypothetical protein